MLNAYRGLLAVHIVFGTVGLAAFWFPILSKKGRTLHKRAGRVFLWCGYVVAATAIAIALLTIASPFGTHPEDRPPLASEVREVASGIRITSAFLAYLGLVTLASVHHGVRAMETKKDPAAMRTPFHTWIHWLAIASSAGVLAIGALFGVPALMALSPIGLYVGLRGLRYASRPRKSRMSHWYEHMGAMIGGGIAFYTAFVVTGVQRFFPYRGDGLLGILPWVLPGVIGTAALVTWERHYRRKFGEVKKPAPRPV